MMVVYVLSLEQVVSTHYSNIFAGPKAAPLRMSQSRLRPRIPLIGNDQIPLHDEIELEMPLAP